MRSTEIELHAGFLLDVAELVELGAVVSGDGPHKFHPFLNKLDEFSVEFIGRSGTQLSDEGVSRFTFDECDDAVPVVGSDDGVDFPVSET